MNVLLKLRIFRFLVLLVGALLTRCDKKTTQVMFPVLQAMGSETAAGHYYLLVLNLRAKRFEVMDSMRSLEDESLRKSCDTMIEGIKTLWRKHYPNSNHDIEDYELVDIGVPKQSNK
jgi:hypothetical protein